jgi:hypothetical protein
MYFLKLKVLIRNSRSATKPQFLTAYHVHGGEKRRNFIWDPVRYAAFFKKVTVASACAGTNFITIFHENISMAEELAVSVEPKTSDLWGRCQIWASARHLLSIEFHKYFQANAVVIHIGTSARPRGYFSQFPCNSPLASRHTTIQFYKPVVWDTLYVVN